MSIYYSSTRNANDKVTASQAILKGLADDGGLFVPSEIPALDVSLKDLADMTYQQWYDKYVKDNPEALKKEHEAKNILSDKKQYEKYKGILGDKAPETLEKFITIKYNEEDKEWEQLKSLTVSKNFLQNQLPYIINGEKNFIPIHTKFDTTPKVIAGVGTNNPIRSIERLINLYGGTERKLLKLKVTNTFLMFIGMNITDCNMK